MANAQPSDTSARAKPQPSARMTRSVAAAAAAAPAAAPAPSSWAARAKKNLPEPPASAPGRPAPTVAELRRRPGALVAPPVAAPPAPAPESRGTQPLDSPALTPSPADAAVTTAAAGEGESAAMGAARAAARAAPAAAPRAEPAAPSAPIAPAPLAPRAPPVTVDLTIRTPGEIFEEATDRGRALEREQLRKAMRKSAEEARRKADANSARAAAAKPGSPAPTRVFEQYRLTAPAAPADTRREEPTENQNSLAARLRALQAQADALVAERERTLLLLSAERFDKHDERERFSGYELSGSMLGAPVNRVTLAALRGPHAGPTDPARALGPAPAAALVRTADAAGLDPPAGGAARGAPQQRIEMQQQHPYSAAPLSTDPQVSPNP